MSQPVTHVCDFASVSWTIHFLLAEAPIQFKELIIYSKEELGVENFLCISLN